jgi:hypothetical protein
MKGLSHQPFHHLILTIRIAALLTIATSIQSCNGSERSPELRMRDAMGEGPAKSVLRKEYSGPFSEVELDGCVYIVYAIGYKSGICHKGNCPNPIHASARADTCRH